MQFSNQLLPTEQPQQPLKKKKQPRQSVNKIKLMGSLFVTGMIILQIVTLFFVLELRSSYGVTNRQIITEVSNLTSVSASENPTIAIVSNANELRNENAIHAQVYNEAMDGDYVLGYTDKMIIYRRSENRIIYEGKSPVQILQQAQSSLTDSITAQAKELKLIPNGSEETPQINIVSDPDNFIGRDSGFYKDLKKDDIVAIFNQSGAIIVYRPSTEEIVNSGTFSVSIK